MPGSVTILAPSHEDLAGRSVVRRATPSGVALLSVLGVALAIDQADGSVIGAVAPSLKHHLQLTNSTIGLLASLSSIAGAALCIPVGIWVDRHRRTRLLSIALVSWSAAMVLTGAALNFAMLAVGAVLLGGVTAVARPIAVSLVGDTYPSTRRGRAMAVIDGFQTGGTGLGYLLAGVAVAVLSWRWAFWALALLGILLVARTATIPEPPRGSAEHSGPVVALPTRAGRQLTLSGDQSRRSLLATARYLISIRTNMVILVADAVGNFFFAGMSTFAVVYVTAQYGMRTSLVDLAMPVVGVGILAGTIIGGRLADRAVASYPGRARLLVAAGAYVIAAIVFVPAIVTHDLLVAGPLLVIAAGALSAANPAMDAVRIDIVHPQIRGRAEALRTLLSLGSYALAPITFGALSARLAGGGHRGLEATFLVMLGAVAANGLILLAAHHSYPHDAAAVRLAATTRPAAA